MEYADIKYSKELKDEFPDAEMWWIAFQDEEEPYHKILHKDCDDAKGGKIDIDYPALTTDMLIDRLVLSGIRFKIVYFDNEYTVAQLGTPYTRGQDKSRQNALSKMVIYLKEENLLKEVN